MCVCVCVYLHLLEFIYLFIYLSQFIYICLAKKFILSEDRTRDYNIASPDNFGVPLYNGDND